VDPKVSELAWSERTVNGTALCH